MVRGEVGKIPKDASLVSGSGTLVGSGPIYEGREYKKQFRRERGRQEDMLNFRGLWDISVKIPSQYCHMQV